MRAYSTQGLVFSAMLTLACASTGTSPATAEVTTGSESDPGDGDPGDGDPGDGDPGDGDPGDGDGDMTGDGDPGDGDGDMAGDGDGDPGDGEVCPAGLDGQTPALDGVTLELVATPPDDGYPAPGAFEILEGPVWIDGTLYVSHIAGGGPPPKSRILALVDGSLEPFSTAAGTNGLAVDARGRMVVARHSDGTISTLDLAAPDSFTPWVSAYAGERFNSPNDLVLSSAGHLYFSDPNWQAPDPNPQPAERAYYVLDGGEPVAFAGEVAKPNGVMLALDEATLYVGGVNGLYAYAVEDDGSVGGGSEVLAVGDSVDGMAKDCAGNLYVVSEGRVVVLDPGGQVLGELELAGLTNVAFGGPERTTLFATTLQEPGLYAAELSIPGYPY